MAASWPGAVKNFSTVINGVTKLVAALFNSAYDEITAVQTNLSGSVVQVVNQLVTANTSCATAIPNDNNARSSAEGNQILTLAITPKSNSNKLRIDIVVNAGSSTQNGAPCIILMDGTTVLATGRNGNYSTITDQICLTYWMTSPGTSAKTFNVNLGAASGTVVLNANQTAQVDAGKCTSSITITEIRA